jgi:D-alanyl-D-alanine carboxypeptidase
VTARQLLNHTSGYGDVYASPAIQPLLMDMEHPWTRLELLDAVEAPLSPPGSAFGYSNTNYIILAEVLERATGRTLDALFADDIASPLGLTATTLLPRPRDLFVQGVIGEGPDAIRPFDLTAGVPTALYGVVFGDGPVAGTAAEAAQFLDALLRGDLLQPESLDAMLDFSGNPLYGLGLMRLEIDGLQWYGHTGAFGGYTAVALHNPTLDITLVTLANHQPLGGTPSAAEVIASGFLVTIPEPSATVATLALLSLLATFWLRRR